MPVAGRRALVTGAGGFVGANLVRGLLDTGATVHVIVRSETDLWRLNDVLPRVHPHTVNLTDAAGVRATVSRVEPEVIFHLARHRGDPSRLSHRSAYEHNLGATLNLLEAAAGSAGLRRFVHAGSSLEYALTRSPLCEDSAPAPDTVHGVTKAAAALLCQQFSARHGVPTVVLRFFTVYGPWQDATRFVPSVVKAALTGGRVRLTRPGLVHDWTYVGDVVDACMRAVTAAGVEGEILNIATGTATSNEDVVHLVEALRGAPIGRDEEAFPERPWDSERWVADVSKAQRLLKWRAPTSLHEGLARTLAWFVAHFELYQGKTS